MKKVHLPLLILFIFAGAGCSRADYTQNLSDNSLSSRTSTTNSPSSSPVLIFPFSTSTLGVSYTWPSQSSAITQYASEGHMALDIAGEINSPVLAAAAGTVEKAECDPNPNDEHGCYIVINHGNNIKTAYEHNNKLLVKPGDNVTVGQNIALLGTTGKLYGLKNQGVLHFGVEINNQFIDPLVFYPDKNR